MELALQDIQQRAVDGGFVYDNTNEETPLARRANLRAFFAHHGVTCASDYKKMVAALSSSEPSPPSLPAGWISLTPSSSVRYFGQAQSDLPHGLGVQLAQTPQRRVLYCGEFVGGQREGLGLMLGARGERYCGRWQGDEIWGLGEYCFAQDGAAGEGAGRTPVSFRGMFAGRPAGPGMMERSGGEQEWGIWRGLDRTADGEDVPEDQIMAAAAADKKRAEEAARMVLLQTQMHCPKLLRAAEQALDLVLCQNNDD